MTASYIPLERYKRKWIFNNHEIPVSEQEKQLIKPLTEKSSMELWNRFISNKSNHSEQFTKGDWGARSNSWKKADTWQTAWDSQDNNLPLLIAEDINWPDETCVYFAYDKYNLIETNWLTFKNNWKCFLFFDDGPLLFSTEQKQVIWFHQSGEFQVGHRG
ncbi:DUF2947 family protein [Parashewanella curva]|uniref:DUF2947 family protein n=1 Tax=Parashewanella curva TaxID=2338552 RepID=A0A3L8PYB0_9GAMM|nr:DUF2947 domain-containing protein [Parashewanella curva]RLV59623.1 DUF2947 family protein [Parashewanella curva]